MNPWLIETELNGDVVKLIPLQRKHRNDLLNAAADGALWNLWYTSVPSEKTIDNYIDVVLREKEEDKALPFVVIDKTTDTIIGTTRYCNVVPNHRRLEIGYTWYAKS